ncbi:MAG: hypothetical protein QOH88_1651 [Verrucomicrobiota bacterium]|jgi:ferric-dicitrate binding protein FerR (iron transport regulator)
MGDRSQGSDRAVADQVRATGSFVDRAIVREMKIAAERFPEHHATWLEVDALIQRWEQGLPDLQVLEALRQVNRTASCWRDKPSASF